MDAGTEKNYRAAAREMRRDVRRAPEAFTPGQRSMILTVANPDGYPVQRHSYFDALGHLRMVTRNRLEQLWHDLHPGQPFPTGDDGHGDGGNPPGTETAR